MIKIILLLGLGVEKKKLGLWSSWKLMLSMIKWECLMIMEIILQSSSEKKKRENLFGCRILNIIYHFNYLDVLLRWRKGYYGKNNSSEMYFYWMIHLYLSVIFSRKYWSINSKKRLKCYQKKKSLPDH